VRSALARRAAGPSLEGLGGRSFEDCREAAVIDRLNGIIGVLPHALDPDAARRLWDVSEHLVDAARADLEG
jgi:hypothetical protein